MIFYSLIKPSMNEKGEKEMSTISISSALQIAGEDFFAFLKTAD